MNDGMQYDPIQGQGHEPFKVGNLAIFKSYFIRHLQWELANDHGFISLTCIICKIMESIIKDQVMSYELENELISNYQHEFLSRHFTCSQLLECVNDWSLALNSRLGIHVIYVDFGKAFDSVVHSKLLAKLESYGITGKFLLRLQDFLSDCTQAVKIGTIRSSFTSVLSGVPQGSVLGRLMFLLFMNDIVDVLGQDLTVKIIC